MVAKAESGSMGLDERWDRWRSTLSPALVLTRREVKDALRDWRILIPILLLTTVFPFLANFAAQRGLGFVNQYGAELLIERLFPFLMLVVGFFPSSFSLVIALEAFVGEKERRSLEPLLATPLTDLQLYVGKLLSSTFIPIAASYFAIGFYTVLLGTTVGWWPNLSLLAVAITLSTTQAFVMVNAAVVVSSQATSTRAANLVASFIIIPVAFLLQAEASLLLFGNYTALWLLALFLLVMNVILLRMGIRVFNREHLLGQDLDRIDFVGGLRTFWRAFWPEGGLKGLYLREVPRLVGALRVELVVTLLVVFAGGTLVGLWGAAHFPLPAGALDVPDLLEMDDFRVAVEGSGLLSTFSASAIAWNNVRSLLLAAFLATFTLGMLALLLLMAPMAIIAYATTQIQKVGIDPTAFLATFVLPHGIIELPAAILATAQAFRIGMMILRAPEGGGGVMGMVREMGHFAKLFLAVIVPLLLVAAWIEAEITPRLVIELLNSLG